MNDSGAVDDPRAVGGSKADTDWSPPDEAPFIRIEHLSKRFGVFTAVDDVSLSIYGGELFSILGGSGCGKTTLLRMLAGFELPSSGRILIDGVDMAGLAPYERPVNMMFQSYALFPHMSVRGNVGYGLRKEGRPAAEIEQRVNEMLELVQLQEFGDRKPASLSGGQSQRVALARALVKRPKVLLLDEPLAALDRKLRERTQFELASIQYRLGVTFVVVTHDQDEAMTLSTRIAVMDKGRVLQLGTPGEVYEFPRSRQVAEFIGSINLLAGEVTACAEGRLQVFCEALGAGVEVAAIEGVNIGDSVTVALRPEKIFIGREAKDFPGGTVLRAVVQDLGYYGNRSLYRVETGNGHMLQVSRQNRRRSARRALQWDDEVYVWWDSDAAIVLAE